MMKAGPDSCAVFRPVDTMIDAQVTTSVGDDRD
jgi:hypothetical protein